MREAKAAEKALIQVNRRYLMDAMHSSDIEYIEAFNNMMVVLRRLQK